jgi:protein-S-isoprenylcysteine O-methyltransferase Ste14
MTVIQKLQAVFLRISGYLVPLVQQIPTLGIYTGLMSLPLLAFLAIFFTQFPLNIIGLISEYIAMNFMSPSVLIANLITIIGLLLTIFSIIYFHRHKKDGLVTSGPYRFIRHPQYTGFLLMTLGLTAFCYWWLSNTFGIGWLSKEATLALWFVQLAIYTILALLEESYLAKQFGDQYFKYKANVSFLLPIGKVGRLDIPLTISLMSLVMSIVILVQSIGFPFTFA